MKLSTATSITATILALATQTTASSKGANSILASSPTLTSPGCSRTSLPDNIKLGQSKYLNISSTSVNNETSTRRYRIHVPESYKPGTPVPLIFSFHGRGKTAKYQEELSQFSNASFGFEGISVYPQGLAPNGTNQWQGDPDQPPSINDIHYTLELHTHLLTTFCIDPSAVYASGKSNGGGFTGLLACSPLATRKFAAFAAVAGAFYLDNATGELPPCRPAVGSEVGRDAVPFMELHGLRDGTIEYGGGLNSRGNARSVDVRRFVGEWAERDGFEIAANVTGTLCAEAGGNETVTTYQWGNTLQHYTYANMGHTWMSEFGNRDSETQRTCAEADATRVILDWFAKWKFVGTVV